MDTYSRHISVLVCVGIVILGVSQGQYAQAQTRLFEEVTASARVTFNHQSPVDSMNMAMGTGAAWLDFDQDDDLDLYVTQGIGANRLFQNQGNGNFVDVAAQLGVDDASRQGGGVAVADFNNDGWPDLYLANSDGDVLFKNEGGSGFTDITPGSGLETSADARGMGAAWGDYNNDGYLDLYVANHMHLAGLAGQRSDHLYLNNGDETFTDVSSLLGEHKLNGYSFVGTWTDYDNDGDQDLFLINDCEFAQFTPTNLLFRNDGGADPASWQFTDVSEEVGAAQCEAAMGIAVSDYNRDGWLDYYFTNWGRTYLLENQEGQAFSDVTAAAGILFDNTWTWGANFFDYDLDGWQDLYIAAGTLLLTKPSSNDPQPNTLFRNHGSSGTFENLTIGSGLDNIGRSRTSIFGDYDNDGDPDMYLVNCGESGHLYRNENGNSNHYLVVELQGTVSNRDGIGAHVRVRMADGSYQLFETRSGSSLGGGDDRAAYFGMGDQDHIEELIIRWPSGIVQRLTDVTVDQRLKVVEPAEATGRDEENAVPEAVQIDVYPNPVTETAQLEFSVPTAGHVEIGLYNLLGQRVKTLYQNVVQPTTLHRVNVEMDGLVSGSYIYRMQYQGQMVQGMLVRMP